MTTITVNKDIKKSGNYNSIGAGITITMDLPHGVSESDLATEMYGMANQVLKNEMENLPGEQLSLIAPRKPDTEGYR
jgi:hypothetical protein